MFSFFKKKPEDTPEEAAPTPPSAPPPPPQAVPGQPTPSAVQASPGQRYGNLAAALKASSRIPRIPGSTQSAIYKPKVSVVLNAPATAAPAAAPEAPAAAPEAPAALPPPPLDLTGTVQIQTADILTSFPDSIFRPNAKESGLIPPSIAIPIADIFPQLSKGKVQLPIQNFSHLFPADILDPSAAQESDISIKIPLHLIIPQLPENLMATTNEAKHSLDQNVDPIFPERSPSPAAPAAAPAPEPAPIAAAPEAPQAPVEQAPAQAAPAAEAPAGMEATKVFAAKPPLKIPRISSPVLKPAAPVAAAPAGEQTLLVRPVAKTASSAKPVTPPSAPPSNISGPIKVKPVGLPTISKAVPISSPTPGETMIRPPLKPPSPVPRPSNLGTATPPISPPTLLMPSPIKQSKVAEVPPAAPTAAPAPAPAPEPAPAAAIPAAPAVSPASTLHQLIGIPDGKELRIQEIVEQIRNHLKLSSVLIATADGLPLAGSMPPELDSNSWSTLANIIFRTSSSKHAVTLGAPYRYILSFGQLWITLLFHNGIYLIVSHKSEDVTTEFEQRNSLLIRELSQFCQQVKKT